MRRYIGLALVACFILAGPSFAANELKNARFESGTQKNWEEFSPGRTDVSITGDPTGNSYFSAIFNSSNFALNRNMFLSQGFNILPDTAYRFGARILSFTGIDPLREGAKAWVSLAWYTDSSKQNLIGSLETSALDSPNDTWEKFKSFGQSPDNANYAELYLNVFSPKMKGNSQSVYFDNAFVRVNAAPEPISSALFLIGGAALAVRQYRKKGKKS